MLSWTRTIDSASASERISVHNVHQLVRNTQTPAFVRLCKPGSPVGLVRLVARFRTALEYGLLYYGCEIELGKSKNLWVIKENGLSGVRKK